MSLHKNTAVLGTIRLNALTGGIWFHGNELLVKSLGSFLLLIEIFPTSLPRQSYRLQEITTTYENTISIIAHVKTVKEGVAYL